MLPTKFIKQGLGVSGAEHAVNDQSLVGSFCGRSGRVGTESQRREDSAESVAPIRDGVPYQNIFLRGVSK